jgi:hypothetical protein
MLAKKFTRGITIKLSKIKFPGRPCGEQLCARKKLILPVPGDSSTGEPKKFFTVASFPEKTSLKRSKVSCHEDNFEQDRFSAGHHVGGHMPAT